MLNNKIANYKRCDYRANRRGERADPDTIHTVYHFMQDLANNYYENEQLQYLHDNVKFVIIPICNPWGYVNQNYHNYSKAIFHLECHGKY